MIHLPSIPTIGLVVTAFIVGAFQEGIRALSPTVRCAFDRNYPGYSTPKYIRIRVLMWGMIVIEVILFLIGLVCYLSFDFYAG